ncbi:Uncharacterised protein [uncultured archaeon]|nr:Uncharacterised protein [uncultured archaeon]
MKINEIMEPHYYHCSRAENFESIKKNGLKTSQTLEHSVSDNGIYLFDYLPNAEDYAYQMSEILSTPFDIWQVHIPEDVLLLRDEHPDFEDLGSFVSYENIAPRYLKYIKRVEA